MEDIIVKVNGKEYKVGVEEVESGKIKVNFEGKSYEVETKADIEREILESIASKKGSHGGKSIIKAPLPGTVVAINVKVGQKVNEGDSLIKLVAMKMENDIIAEKGGVVKEIMVRKNESVNKDDILIIVE